MIAASSARLALSPVPQSTFREKRAAPAAVTTRARTISSQSPVKPAKTVREHERQEEEAHTKGEHMVGLAQVKPPYAADKQVGNHQIEEAPKTLTIEDDKPTPGGDANGLWNECPEIPFPRWGNVFARKAPPKK